METTEEPEIKISGNEATWAADVTEGASVWSSKIKIAILKKCYDRWRNYVLNKMPPRKGNKEQKLPNKSTNLPKRAQRKPIENKAQKEGQLYRYNLTNYEKFISNFSFSRV